MHLIVRANRAFYFYCSTTRRISTIVRVLSVWRETRMRVSTVILAVPLRLQGPGEGFNGGFAQGLGQVGVVAELQAVQGEGFHADFEAGHGERPGAYLHGAVGPGAAHVVAAAVGAAVDFQAAAHLGQFAPAED